MPWMARAPMNSIMVRAMAQGWREFLSLWKGYRSKALEYREIDNERVYVLIRVSASGLEIGQTSANVFTLRAAKVTRLAIYWDPQNALTDLGLAE